MSQARLIERYSISPEGGEAGGPERDEADRP
jgi:hypothetical protein